MWSTGERKPEKSGMRIGCSDMTEDLLLVGKVLLRSVNGFPVLGLQIALSKNTHPHRPHSELIRGCKNCSLEFKEN